MKEIIKITIALAVILGSYLLGSHQADDKFSIQLKEVNEKLSVSQSSIEQLKDSINSMKKFITQIKIEKADTIIAKPKPKAEKTVTKRK